MNSKISSLLVFSMMVGCSPKPTPEVKANTEPEVSQSANTTKQQEAPALDRSFIGILTCGMRHDGGMEHMRTVICFTDTDLEIRNGQRYGLFKGSNLITVDGDVRGVGVETDDGLIIELDNSFQIAAQNSSDDFILGLKIIGKDSKNVYYERQVGKFGVIRVQN